MLTEEELVLPHQKGSRVEAALNWVMTKMKTLRLCDPLIKTRREVLDRLRSATRLAESAVMSPAMPD